MGNGYVYDEPDGALWQTLADSITSGATPHTAVRELEADPASFGTGPEGADAVTSLRRSDGTTFTLWRHPDALVVVREWSDGDVRVQSYAATLAAARELADAHAAAYTPAAPVTDGAVRVRFWFQSPFGPSSRTRALACPTWDDVSSNYPAAVRTALNAVMGFAPGDADSGRLLLLEGPPGTGKSYALRALAHSWAPFCDVHYVTDPDEMLRDAAYLTSLLVDADDEARWRLIVMEDSGEYVSDDARSRAGAGLGRLLNAADGLLGQGTKTMFLLTTNEPLEALHPALVRPGRCLAALHLGPFPQTEATAWLGADAAADMTLAEMWERRRDPLGGSPGALAAAARGPEGSPSGDGVFHVEHMPDGRMRVIRPGGGWRYAQPLPAAPEAQPAGG